MQLSTSVYQSAILYCLCQLVVMLDVNWRPALRVPMLICSDLCMLEQNSTTHAVSACLQKAIKQRKARFVVNAVRRSLAAAAVSTSFILTGNLFSPCLTSVSCNLLFSYYQRNKFQEQQRKQKQLYADLRVRLEEMGIVPAPVKPRCGSSPAYTSSE